MRILFLTKYNINCFLKLEMSRYVLTADHLRFSSVLIDTFKRGEIVVVDLTEHEINSIRQVVRVAHRYRYTIYWVGNPCQISNSRKIQFISPIDIRSTLKIPIVDLSHFRRVNHFGDLHGCYSVLMDYFRKYPFKKDEAYIFVGDYIDRGIETAKLLKFLLSIYRQNNVYLLQGNHDRHLWSWVMNYPIDSRYSIESIKVIKHHFSKEEIAQFFLSMQEVFPYSYYEKRVLVTHGGLSNFPLYMKLVSSRQLTNGVGDYKTPIDKIFFNNTGYNEFQIHGHRNLTSVPTQVNSRTFNLEGGIEYGGDLRVVQLSQSGFSSLSLPNRVYSQEYMDTSYYLYDDQWETWKQREIRNENMSFGNQRNYKKNYFKNIKRS